MDSRQQMYGVTPPMNMHLPTDAERRATDALLEELRRQNTFENPADTAKREKVLESLKRICNEFVKQVARTREPKNEILIRNAIGKVFTYGSYRLGVYGPGSDIDTLIVAPKYVTREDYFEHFPKLLVKMAPEGAITGLTVVTDAFVPIIKFEYSDISIDLIFSRIIQKQLSEDLTLKDSALLRGLDEAELRSVNGTRVTDEILELVPERSTFRQALRAIKLWAQRRAVYANIMGFPGGVAWAMLVARVCQLYPKAAAAVVVNKFFLIISQWQWPQPVLLKPIESGPLPVRVWNPRIYRGDSFHLMPVITPAYPSMCATFNITRSSMTVVQRELKHAFEITEKVMTGKRPWSDLFVKHTFFTSGYKYYISVIASSKTKEAHKIWSGYVESKVRMLVQKLEQHPSITMAHAFNKGYERRHICTTSEEIHRVQDGSMDYVVSPDSSGSDVAGNEGHDDTLLKKDVEQLPEKGDDTSVQNQNGTGAPKTEVGGPCDHESADKTEEPPEAPAAPKATEIFTMTHYIGIELADDARSLDLSYQVDDFKALCTSWQKYQEELQDVASIGVQHCRNFNLPDDVFEPGEQKPQKKKGGAKNAPNGKKRDGSEENSKPPPAKRQQASIAAAG